LSCKLPNLFCNRVIILAASIPLVAHRRILDRKRSRRRRGASVSLLIGTLKKAVRLATIG
jgi:hypothetical protein